MRDCKFRLIEYQPSMVGMTQGLYSFGTKRILCSKQPIVISGFDLSSIFNHFFNENCKECKYREERDENWVLKFNDLEKMSIEIQKICKN